MANWDMLLQEQMLHLSCDCRCNSVSWEGVCLRNIFCDLCLRACRSAVVSGDTLRRFYVDPAMSPLLLANFLVFFGHGSRLPDCGAYSTQGDVVP